MMQALRFFWRNNVQSIGVIGFAVLIILLGHVVPTAPLEYFLSPTDSSPRWSSIYSDGLSVWFQAVLIAELLVLFSRKLHASRLNQSGHANPFHPCLLAVALIWTFFSGWHYWAALRGHFILPDRGIVDWPIISAMALVSGLALAILLGMLLERRWSGYGFWLVILINYSMAIPAQVASGWERLRMTPHELRDWLVLLVLVGVAFVGGVASTQVSRSVDEKDNRTQLFLWALSSAAAGWIAQAVALTIFPIWPAFPWIRGGILVLLGLVVFFPHDPMWLRVVQVALLLASLIAYYVLDALGLRLSFISGGDVLIWAWVATRLLQAWRTARQQTAIDSGVKA